MTALREETACIGFVLFMFSYVCRDQRGRFCQWFTAGQHWKREDQMLLNLCYLGLSLRRDQRQPEKHYLVFPGRLIEHLSAR